MSQLHCLAYRDLSAVRLLLPGDHAQQRRLARPVRSDHAHDAPGEMLALRSSISRRLP